MILQMEVDIILKNQNDMIEWRFPMTDEIRFDKEDGKQIDESKVIAKIMAYEEPFRSMGLAIHDIIIDGSPDIHPRVWYGMPGYARSKNQPVMLFFRNDAQYMTLGYTEKVGFHLDEESEHRMMPCAWFFKELDDATRTKIYDIAIKALGD